MDLAGPPNQPNSYQQIFSNQRKNFLHYLPKNSIFLTKNVFVLVWKNQFFTWRPKKSFLDFREKKNNFPHWNKKFLLLSPPKNPTFVREKQNKFFKRKHFLVDKESDRKAESL